MDSQVISVPDAGKRLGICRLSAYRAARSGEIPTIRLGRRLVVPLPALERMLEGEEGKKEEATA